MSNKPDFIVDPYGNVQDVRGSKNASGSQSYSSQNSRAWVPREKACKQRVNPSQETKERRAA